MAFERFTRGRSRIGKPQASIWTRGQIGLNQGAVHTFELDKYDYAVLFFDKETNRIGIKFTDDKREEGTIKLIKRKTGGMSLSANAFLSYYEIQHSKIQKYDLQYDKENDLYVIQL